MIRILRHFLLLASCLSLMAGCKPHTMAPLPSDSGASLYASLLQMAELPEGTLCRIAHPWDSTSVAAQYLLVPAADSAWDATRLQQVEGRYGAVAVVRTPLQRCALTNACHAWLMAELDALPQVAVMCDPSYLLADTLRQWMAGRLTHPSGQPIAAPADGGQATAPNIEVLLASQCDAVWLTPFDGGLTALSSDVPMSTIYCADYLENTPLGRAEWMRFYGRLMGQGERADSLFAVVSSRYLALADSMHASDIARPTLLTELPYQGTWYVPGGSSYAARLYADAGYRYAWAEDTHSGSLALSCEAVIAQAADCQQWLIKYYDPDGTLSLDALMTQDRLYAQFHAARTGQVWGCNTAVSDYFDVTPFRPDLLLESLIAHDEKYFRQLQAQ